MIAVLASVTSCRSTSAPAPAASASAAAPREPGDRDAGGASAPRFTYVGRWSGSYRAVPHRIDLPPRKGGLPEWKIESKRGIGPGKVTITVATDKTITGEATGALGPQEIRGVFDEPSFGLRFISKTPLPAGYSGTVTLHPENDRLEGTLEVSSADGRDARSGTVTLTKAR